MSDSKERESIVKYLRAGGDWFSKEWFAWDSEMAAYADGFADMIERGDHFRTRDSGHITCS